MSPRKKTRKTETVQATLGELAKKPSKKTTSKKKSTVKTTRRKAPAKKGKTKTSVKKEPQVVTGPPLTSLPGVGSKLRDRLRAAGYDSVLKLSKARSKSVAKKVNGLSKTGAKNLVRAAKDSLKVPEKSTKLKPVADAGPEDAVAVEITQGPAEIPLSSLPGVGAKMVRKLEDSGYNSVSRLSRARPQSVARLVSGLSTSRAKMIVLAAKKAIQDREMQALTGTVVPKIEPKPVDEPVAPKEEVPTEIVVAAKKTESKMKSPQKKDSLKKKPSKKKPKKKDVEKIPTKHPRTKAKKKKSGLPVPAAVTRVAKQMKKKWRDAEKRAEALAAGAEPEEGELTTEDTVQVVGLTSDETRDKLIQVAMEVLNETMMTGRPAFEIPRRSADNIVWDEIRDLLLLGMKTITRPYHSLASVVDATRTARVMEIIFQLLKANLHATKREVFYSDVNLFREQKYSDKIIEDVASMLRTTRDSVHVVASARGSAMGRVVIRDGGDTIDLTKMGTGGWAITPFLDQVEILESDAEFILLSEKDAAVMRLSEAKYWNRQPCIVLTGKGSGDIATRAFLKTLVKELEIPAFALVDSDPYGHYIYSVFLRGSKRLSYESPFIATPELKLLGVLSRDLDAYNIPKAVRIPMEPTDIKRVKDMLKEPFIRKNKAWVKDLKLMLQLKEKAEIQAFASHSFQYLTDEYLPTKLETGDWI
ncbi:MAG: helix-hairpin-helix domain-containing protein, partial [Candidatus Thorarchaeota archaeon]